MSNDARQAWAIRQAKAESWNIAREEKRHASKAFHEGIEAGEKAIKDASEAYRLTLIQITTDHRNRTKQIEGATIAGQSTASAAQSSEEIWAACKAASEDVKAYPPIEDGQAFEEATEAALNSQIAWLQTCREIREREEAEKAGKEYDSGRVFLDTY
jgi:hypothetical protein